MTTTANTNNYHVRVQSTTPTPTTTSKEPTICTFAVFALPLAAVIEARRRRNAATQRKMAISKTKIATIPSHERQALREALKTHLHQSR
ncbi:hypothetical protein QKT49_gp278 [Acanthamoeba castellanii medusavirus]|uniref:Uncharacterized protein n=1 Tax=Acanthamoeba castellanii medusavirus J1 TaxID=3114988 RepID=A0A3T1CXG7_9VIRU|nr:hypothetical protein QKT49_gp278 [Acanthamoeba castellanii medusavirus]BBI30485.1 hypothetical protein [Acanthamoeba castellanii medusavirus J1]